MIGCLKSSLPLSSLSEHPRSRLSKDHQFDMYHVFLSAETDIDIFSYLRCRSGVETNSTARVFSECFETSKELAGLNSKHWNLPHQFIKIQRH